MALLWAEKFDIYNVAADIAGTNDGVLSPLTAGVATNDRWGTTGKRSTTLEQQFRYSDRSSNTTMIVSLALIVNLETISLGRTELLFASTATTANTHWRLYLTRAGSVQLNTAGSSGAPLAQSLPGVIRNNTWHRVEIKVTCLDSGTAEVRVDGVTVIGPIAGDFRNGTGNTSALEQIRIPRIGPTATAGYDEILIMDASGTTLNDFLGDVRFELEVASTQGATTDWTASAGTQVQCIDDAIPLASANFDTDYISSSTAGQDNLAGHVAASLTNVSSIHAVQLATLARNDGSNTISHNCRGSDGTLTNQVVQSPTTLVNGTYRWKTSVFRNDPATAAVWANATAINNAQFGVRAI